MKNNTPKDTAQKQLNLSVFSALYLSPDIAAFTKSPVS